MWEIEMAGDKSLEGDTLAGESEKAQWQIGSSRISQTLTPPQR